MLLWKKAPGNLDLPVPFCLFVRNDLPALCGRTVAFIGGGVTVRDTKTGEEAAIPAGTVVLPVGVRSSRPDYADFKAAYDDRLILAGDTARHARDAAFSGRNPGSS